MYDVGVADGHHFIAAEYVEGETLRQRLAAPIPISDVLEMATQIGEALAAAHAAGIVHRDLKPENVIVRHDGVVKIVDFGLAKLLVCRSRVVSASSSESVPGVVLGTSAYMSPEQAEGMEVDGRSDVFSFGVVLFELIVGRVPFSGKTPSQVIASILRDDAPSVAAERSDIPKGLGRVIAKALRKDPGDRYQSIGDMVAELRTDIAPLDRRRRIGGDAIAPWFGSPGAGARARARHCWWWGSRRSPRLHRPDGRTQSIPSPLSASPSAGSIQRVNTSWTELPRSWDVACPRYRGCGLSARARARNPHDRVRAGTAPESSTPQDPS